MKKILALVLALILSLSLAAPAMAVKPLEGMPTAQIVKAEDFEIGTEAEPWGQHDLANIGHSVTLPFMYTFTAQDDPETEKFADYADWKCDFVVSVNRDLADGEAYLVGNYTYGSGDSAYHFNWIGFTGELQKGVEVPLVSTMLNLDNKLTYREVYSIVNNFRCGAFAGDNLKEDLVLTVMLCMWDSQGNRYELNTFVETLYADGSTSGDVTFIPEEDAGNASVTVTPSIAEAMKDKGNSIIIPIVGDNSDPSDDITVTVDPVAAGVLASVAGENSQVIDIVIETSTDVADITDANKKAAAEEVGAAVVIEASIYVNGATEATPVNFGNGKVKVEIPFTPATGTNVEDYSLLFIDDNGEIDVIPSTYENGKLIANLSHFSTYVIGIVPTSDCACELASQHLLPGTIYELNSLDADTPDNKDYKVSKIDFTTGNFSGASLIDSVKWNKTAGAWQLTLKNHYSLSEERALKGTITFKGTGANKGTPDITVDIDETVSNHIQTVSGERKANDVTTALDTFVAPLIIMDEDGGYVKFQEEALSGTVKMNKEEKAFLNIFYGYIDDVTEDTIDAFEDFVGEDYIDEAIIEYYTFETRAFKNEVSFAYDAWEDDPHFFYLWDGEKLSAIDAKFDDDEDVEAYVWTGLADGTIIVTDVEIVLAAEESKNPDTGASDVVGVASALAVVSLVAAGAISLKK